MPGEDQPAKSSKAPPGMVAKADGSYVFAPGNQLWKLALRAGLSKRLYLDPQDLLEEVCGYFKWLEDNPLFESKLVSYEGSSSIEEIPKMRAATIGGMCLYLGIDESTWRAWRSQRDAGHRAELSAIIKFAEGFIRDQKFGGAASGLLNATIISRDLGLTEKTEIAGPGGGPIAIDVSGMSMQALLELRQAVAVSEKAQMAADEEPDTQQD
jgi:hypothetical protein